MAEPGDAVKNKRVPPPGHAWRIKAGGVGREPSFELRSRDYPGAHAVPADHRTPHRADFDEFVLLVDERRVLFHIERMDTRTWFLCVGEDRIMVRVKADGAVEKGEWYK